MALIKYTGVENVVVNLNGERKLIKPNKIFSGPVTFKDYPNFQVIGYTKDEKDGKESGKKLRASKSLKLEIKDYFTPTVDMDYLDETGLPKISICIVTKDGYDNIKRCLDSIHKYTKYVDFEVLICDTGTTDENVFHLYTEYHTIWNDGLYDDDTPESEVKENFKVFKDHDYNFSKNNNFLAKEASGDVLLFMNNDVFLTYDAVSEMVGYILCSNIGCLGHRLVYDRDKNVIQHDGQVLYQPWDGRWNGPGHYNLGRKLQEISTDNVKVEGVTAAFLMMRKGIFEKVNGFNEDYVDILQDVDLNLKVNQLGYDNFCIREKAIIHVDHGSRKTDVKEESRGDFQKFHTDWVSKGPYKFKKKKHFSILICATDKKQVKVLLESIKSREEYEFIFVNNRSNYFWSSEALNQLTRVSEGEIMFWMHQDVTFDAYEPFATITDIVTKLGGEFGILGPAGIQVGGKGSIRGVDFSSLKYTFDFLRCQTLDEFCLIGNRKNKMMFGEYLDHFHFYGADICMQAADKGLSNYVIKLPITHHSGGDTNLKKRGGYEAYLKQGRKFYKKWGGKHPFISTTTVHFRKEYAFWYLGKMLGLTPYKETIEPREVDETPNEKHYLTKKDFRVEKYLEHKKEGVSIVILNKDKPDYIKKCVNAIIEHTEAIEYEILIGDTGTTDIEVKEFYQDKSAEYGDKIKVIDAGEYHFSRNNNLVAANHARYNKTLFMNNDVFINSDIITSMAMRISEKVAIVGAKLLYENGTIQHAGVEMIISKERNPHKFYLPEHMHYEEKNKEIESGEVDCVTGACLMIPTKLFNDYSGFDEGYEHVFQDVDLCLAIKKMGYKIWCRNDKWATHVESGSRDSAINEGDYNLMTDRWGRITYK
jgi:GT2 family glycosyltransferase